MIDRLTNQPEIHRIKNLRMFLARTTAIAVLSLGFVEQNKIEAQPQERVNISTQALMLLPDNNPHPTPHKPFIEFDRTDVPSDLADLPVHIFGQAYIDFVIYALNATSQGNEFANGVILSFTSSDQIDVMIPSGYWKITATKTADDFRFFNDMSQLLVCEQVDESVRDNSPVTHVIYDRLHGTSIDCGDGESVMLPGDVYSASFDPHLIDGRRVNPWFDTHISNQSTIYGSSPDCTLSLTADVVNGQDARGTAPFIIGRDEWFIASVRNATITAQNCRQTINPEQIVVPILNVDTPLNTNIIINKTFGY